MRMKVTTKLMMLMVNMRIMCLQQMIMYENGGNKSVSNPINKNKFDDDDKDDNKVSDDNFDEGKLKDNVGSKYALGQGQLS